MRIMLNLQPTLLIFAFITQFEGAISFNQPQSFSSKSCKQARSNTRPSFENFVPAKNQASPNGHRYSLVNFSSANPENGRNGRNRRKIPIPNPVKIIRSFVTKVIVAQSIFRKKFSALSKKGKLIVCLQLTALGLMFGAVTKQAVNQRSARLRNGVAMEKPVEVPYSVFMDMVERSGKGHIPGQNPAIQVDQLVIGREKIGFRVDQDAEKHEIAVSNQKLVEKDDVSVQPVKPRLAYAEKVNASPELVNFLRENKIPFKAASRKSANAFAVAARSSILLIYMLFLLRMYRTMSGNGGKADTPGKLAKQLLDDGPMVKFEDIEGIDEAKFEVMELVDTLRNPGKYAILGARAPTGCLLEGPPGTGKTMLARACAATAGVPLLYCSGSDFVEMFVGRGAARVRKTFARAAKIAPVIIFIDELDALGKSRSGEMMGMQMRSNDEAEQTLNQLLACMDGLDSTRGICVLAATNRREVLDQALIRPGRFDRIIKVKLPDTAGRERILRVHAKKLPGFKECQGIDEKRNGSLGKDSAVDLSALAAITQGLSGAELEYIVNEAAIRAVRRISSALRDGANLDSISSPAVDTFDFEESLKNFYETRKPSGNKMGEVLSNVFK